MESSAGGLSEEPSLSLTVWASAGTAAASRPANRRGARVRYLEGKRLGIAIPPVTLFGWLPL
jgi:hypothetical protein